MLALTNVCQAAKHYTLSDELKTAYEQITSLKLRAGRATLASAKAADPDNLLVYYIENYADFFEVLASNSETIYKARKKNEATRIAILATGNSRDPYFAQSQAGVYLQWGTLKAQMGDQLGAFSDISKAQKLLEKNVADHPHFLASRKDLAILHAAVGTIPDQLAWGARMLGGLKGTIKQGRLELEAVLEEGKNTGFFFQDEAEVLYAYLLLHLANDKEKAWQVACSSVFQPRQNPLHAFVGATIASRTAHNDKAIEWLMQAPRLADAEPFPMLDYLLGEAKLRRLDVDANYYLKRFITNNKGKTFQKEALQKMAWYCLTRSNSSDYLQYMYRCRREGSASRGGDKQAYRESMQTIRPLTQLVKARLLFDGGYYQRAKQEMKAIDPKNLAEESHRIEYYYRMGRIYHGNLEPETAKTCYRNTIEQGKNTKYYFACNAALQMGLLYEAEMNLTQARTYYKLCLSMHPAEYEYSLHHQAKAGLNRLMKEN